MPSISSSSLAMPLMRCVVASSKTRPVTAGARGIPSTQVRNLLRASCDRLTKRQQERLREAFVADEAHISVEVAYLHRASARGLPSRHTRPRPTPGRPSHREPTSLSHPRNRPPRGEPYANGRTHSTPTSTQPEPATYPTEAINEHYRTRQTHRQRLPQPHQLPTPNAPHRRRPRRLPHPTMKSQETRPPGVVFRAAGVYKSVGARPSTDRAPTPSGSIIETVAAES